MPVSQQHPVVSVIVPTCARAHVLERCLRPLLNDPATLELLAIADGPNARTHQELRRLSRSDARIRWATIPHRGAGGAGARQVGAELAVGEVLLFVDDDVVAEPGLVGRHAAWHEDGARRIVLGYMPVQYSPTGRLRDLPPALYAESYERMCHLYDDADNNILLNFWSGNFSMRRADVLHLGLFDSAFTPAYHWDRDFGLRCRAAGMKVAFDRDLRARHQYRRSWSQFISDGRRSGYGWLLVHTRHAGVLGPFALSDHEPPGARARALIRYALRPRLRPLIQATLSAAATLACAARRPRLALRLARLVQAIAQQQGALECASQLASATAA